MKASLSMFHLADTRDSTLMRLLYHKKKKKGFSKLTSQPSFLPEPSSYESCFKSENTGTP